MRPTELLRAGCDEDWRAIVEHPFCQAIADGSLPGDKMAAYLLQDRQFLDGFARLLASMIARAPSLNDMAPAAQFLAMITGPASTYLHRAFVALDVPENAQSADPAPETLAYQNLMAEAVATGSYPHMLAVLVASEWSYLSWAVPLHPPREDLPFWLAEWITRHAGEPFAALVEYLRVELDRAWPDLDVGTQSEVSDIFARAVKLERGFFDAAWAGWPGTAQR